MVFESKEIIETKRTVSPFNLVYYLARPSLLHTKITIFKKKKIGERESEREERERERDGDTHTQLRLVREARETRERNERES